MLDRSDIRSALKMRQRVETTYRAHEQAYVSAALYENSLPSTHYFTLGWQQEKLFYDLERSLGAFRRFLLSLPVPSPLSPLALHAREAWERFDEGDPEPLDSFIKTRLGIMANHVGPLPAELRERVFDFLDLCFAPPPLYQPGDWFILGQAELDRLTTLLGDHTKGFGDLRIALSGEGGSFRDRLDEELPGAVRVAWDDIETVSTNTLLNEASNSLRRTKSETHRSLPPSEGDDSLAQFEAQETISQMLDALEPEARLSAQQAEVWQLSRRGMEIAEIASNLGISRNQVSVQKHNAIEKVREAAGR
jgi:RNA polymerase sigma factor (sigma-70 family)